jgi:hypothetical protein
MASSGRIPSRRRRRPPPPSDITSIPELQRPAGGRAHGCRERVGTPAAPSADGGDRGRGVEREERRDQGFSPTCRAPPNVRRYPPRMNLLYDHSSFARLAQVGSAHDVPGHRRRRNYRGAQPRNHVRHHCRNASASRCRASTMSHASALISSRSARTAAVLPASMGSPLWANMGHGSDQAANLLTV